MLSAEQVEVVAGLVARARHTYPADVRPSRDGYQFALSAPDHTGTCVVLLPIHDPRAGGVPVAVELEVGRSGGFDDEFLSSVERALADAAPAVRAA